MHGMMRELARTGVPFYVENPLRSKLWSNPFIQKLLKDTRTSTIIFDYCQFGEKWQKSTQILAFNNKAFGGGLSRRCTPRKEGQETMC